MHVRVRVDRQVRAPADDERRARRDPLTPSAEIQQQSAHGSLTGRARAGLLGIRHGHAAAWRGQAPPGNAMVEPSECVTSIMKLAAASLAVMMMFTSEMTSAMKAT